MLFSHWSIRSKLRLGLALLAISVLALFGSAYYGLYAYRGLVMSISARSAELPLADTLRDRVADLHETLNQVLVRQTMDVGIGTNRTSADSTDAVFLRESYRSKFDLVRPRQTYEELIGLDHLAAWQEKRRR